MKRLFIFVRFITIALLVLQCCSTVFAQGEKSVLGGNEGTSRAGFTGAGAGGSGTTAVKPGGAAWETPYSEGSAVRSTGYTPAT